MNMKLPKLIKDFAHNSIEVRTLRLKKILWKIFLLN